MLVKCIITPPYILADQILSGHTNTGRPTVIFAVIKSSEFPTFKFFVFMPLGQVYLFCNLALVIFPCDLHVICQLKTWNGMLRYRPIAHRLNTVQTASLRLRDV